MNRLLTLLCCLLALTAAAQLPVPVDVPLTAPVATSARRAIGLTDALKLTATKDRKSVV